MEPFLYEEFFEIEQSHWWSVGMRGIARSMLEQATDEQRDLRLADLGCGTGIGLREFRPFGPVFGFDVAWEAVACSKRRDSAARVCQADLRDIPLRDESMDVVLALDVIEHLDDDAQALSQIYRILRTGGIAIINVPAFPSLWSRKDIENHHQRRYRRRDLYRRLIDAGFEVERLTYTNATLFAPIWCARQIQRAMRREWNHAGEYHPHPWLNRALTLLMSAETSILARVDLPFGTSATAVARRPRSPH